MPTLHTLSWPRDTRVHRRIFQSPDRKVRFYVHITHFLSPHHAYAVVEPASRLGPDLFKWFLGICRTASCYDPQARAWIWPVTALQYHLTEELPTTESMTAPPLTSGLVQAKPAITPEQKLAAKAARDALAKQLDDDLAKLVRLECVPPESWPSYSYPQHYSPTHPSPTALQRIVLQRYWRSFSFLLCASVGTGKTRMVVDTANARVLSDDFDLRNSCRIILVIAPLSLHDIWAHEFVKWTPVDPGTGAPVAQWHVHKFNGAKSSKFWEGCLDSSDALFKDTQIPGYPYTPGGIVIITTPQAWSRTNIVNQFRENSTQPTTIVIDEVQRLFRHPYNAAFKHVTAIRQGAFGAIALTGTPTNRPVDWWGLEEIIGGGLPGYHWQGGDYMAYDRAFNPDDRDNCFPLVPAKTSVGTALKSFHVDRIRRGQSFVALKEHYMADSLPGIDQAEIGRYAEQRIGFVELCEKFPDDVRGAIELQQERNPGWSLESSQNCAFVLLTRLQQIAGVSDESEAVLRSFIDDFLDTDEPAVIWTNFIEEQEHVSKILSAHGPVALLSGATPRHERKGLVDGFQEGKYRFFCAQSEAGGVGITLTRAHKSFFNTSPLSYLGMTQAIGRLHRLGQSQDVTSYFNMSAPVSMFVRSIHDKRTEANELLPRTLSKMLQEMSVVA